MTRARTKKKRTHTWTAKGIQSAFDVVLLFCGFFLKWYDGIDWSKGREKKMNTSTFDEEGERQKIGCVWIPVATLVAIYSFIHTLRAIQWRDFAFYMCSMNYYCVYLFIHLFFGEKKMQSIIALYIGVIKWTVLESNAQSSFLEPKLYSWDFYCCCWFHLISIETRCSSLSD